MLISPGTPASPVVQYGALLFSGSGRTLPFMTTWKRTPSIGGSPSLTPFPFRSLNFVISIVAHGLQSTVTLKVHVLLLPEQSVAVYVTSVVPQGKKSPDLWSPTTTGFGSQVSVAVGAVKVTLMPVSSHLSVGNEMSFGHVMVGGVLSWTVMVWCTWFEWLPEQSVASQVLVSVNVPGQAPGVVMSLSKLTVAVPQVSVAVGGVNTGVAGQSMVASSPASVIVGGVMSWTVMVWFTWRVLSPEPSVAS